MTTTYEIDTTVYTTHESVPALVMCTDCKQAVPLENMRLIPGRPSFDNDRALDGLVRVDMIKVSQRCTSCIDAPRQHVRKALRAWLAELCECNATEMRVGIAEMGAEVHYWGPFYLPDGELPLLESDKFGTIYLDNDFYSSDDDSVLHFAYRTKGSDTWRTFAHWLNEKGIELDLEFELP